MENCFTSNSSVHGTTALEYGTYRQFKIIGANIKSQISSLKINNNKEEFRDKCKKLADYLITSKPPYSYINERLWKGALKTWYKHYYTGLSQHGGCFMILNQDEKEILQLVYDAEDFCEKNKEYIDKLHPFRVGNSSTYNCNNDDNCISKCKEYNEWIIERKGHFSAKREILHKDCTGKKKLYQLLKKTCNIQNSSTFTKIIESKSSAPTIHIVVPEKKEDESSLAEQNSPESQEQSPPKYKASSEQITRVERPPPVETLSPGEMDTANELMSSKEQKHHVEKASPFSDPTPVTLSNENTKAQPIKVPQSQNHKGFVSEGAKTTFQHQETSERTDKSISSIPFKALINDSPSPFHLELPKITESAGNISDKYISPILISIIIIIIFSLFIKHMPLIFLKKKKHIKRKHLKLLRILVPSYPGRKNMFLTYDNLEPSTYNNEENIRKIIINEQNLETNVKKINKKKDVSKTIIEVHMEVLEEYKNEVWESDIGEFLAICLEEFRQEKYNSHHNLKNDEIIIENNKCRNDTDKKKILWNKWAERHKNLSEKLKKEYWFNSLKNEWKSERDSIERSKKLKKKLSNKYKKVPSSEIEKDAWKKWISKKGIVIGQYIEKDWHKLMTEGLKNMTDKCVNYETKKDMTITNLEELKKKEYNEELYKYIKKKLLQKLCILVLMMVLEECRKEENIENNESYLDSSIYECKIEKNSYAKSEIIEDINEDKGNVLEYRKNEDIYESKGGHTFIHELNDWIREDNTYINSIKNEDLSETS
ncbi:STP1 protein [Plasmodium malariae]|uniref:STP1 protein n=1 Tax=Plasmodium malariae TaxID=5858 RepID=A0A1D3JLW8_PLAMA|nr:STP1 protein [Plasmodium malariae]SBT87654.1 STP1 protein [Plasmodium malariae]